MGKLHEDKTKLRVNFARRVINAPEKKKKKKKTRLIYKQKKSLTEGKDYR